MRGTVAGAHPLPNEADDLRVSRFVADHHEPGALFESLGSMNVGSDRYEVEIGEFDGDHRGWSGGAVVQQVTHRVIEGVEDTGRHCQIEASGEVRIRRVASLPHQTVGSSMTPESRPGASAPAVHGGPRTVRAARPGH